MPLSKIKTNSIESANLSVTRIGVGAPANTSYGIFNRYFGNSEIATQYGTGTLTGIGSYSSTGAVFSETAGSARKYPIEWKADTGHVTMPNQPALLAQPNAATFTPTASPSGGTIFGLNTCGGIRYNRGFTIGVSSGTTSNFVASGATTGRITVPSAGVYLVMFDQRNEGQTGSGTAAYGNDVNAGQMRLWLNGAEVIRRHVNQWANFPYNHCIIHATLNLNANDYLEFGAWWNSLAASGTWSGTGDTVNWLHIVKLA
jgi:hypothetical protein